MTHLPWRTLSRHARLRSRTLSAPQQHLPPQLQARRAFSPSPSPVAREALESSHSNDHRFDPEADPYPLLPPNRPVLRDAARHQPSTHQSMCTTTNQTTHKMPIQPANPSDGAARPRRKFHNYFITHLPSSSMHPEKRIAAGPGHKLPRDASMPHTPKPGHSPASIPGPGMAHRDMTVVRIPLRSAKHHFGRATSRGTRPYNEDSDQAGTIDMPAFAKRAPISLVRNPQKQAEITPADSSFGDPQIFYFAVFDGHGGSECSEFLRDELHGYIEEASSELGLRSSLGKKHRPGTPPGNVEKNEASKAASATQQVKMMSAEEVEKEMRGHVPTKDPHGVVTETDHRDAIHGDDPVPARVRDFKSAIHQLSGLVKDYRNTVGGYFRRFQPEHFNLNDDIPEITVESVLEYAFLRADLDFISAQARKPDTHDLTAGDAPYNNDEILGVPHATPSGQHIGGRMRFKGGSTASVALLSTPTPAPFWHPSAHATLMVAHVGDTRAILCETSTGLAAPVTSDHHPTAPAEARRLRRYAPAASMVTGDSFGEQRIQGLANSRAFGDIKSKRIGVSAEPEITRLDMTPAQYSFLVLCSDGVSGTLSDQEIVDIVKEAKTPDQGARDVVNLSTEISRNGDNATCLVVRLGGWERRSEGGLGSLGTKEVRDLRRAEALDPRRGKT
ncbi:hypothetical protein jhhlp_001498 [Lomentospora prolificans]|uniref:PPM-type phosphatase domain-containing protein n=1 Tax=Lomentospora prolificans TaxID=41688 RepID=A0A2N3NIB7_9PEZI|nr:hypothetical protein jhhlp_001498 [Lomentospora prolificans]